jgi:hypothetical protein
MSDKVFAASSAGVYQTAEGTFEKLMILAGVNENTDGTLLSFYPNPSHGQIYVSAASDNALVQIFDIHGKLLLRKEISGLNESLDLQSYSKGIYLLKITNGKSSATKRLVIN